MVAVVRYPGQDGLFVKRLSHKVGDAWWAIGDNQLASSDSRDYGPAEVVGRVLASLVATAVLGTLSSRPLEMRHA